MEKSTEVQLVGRARYINGDVQEFTDAEEFLRCLREELPYSSTTGFKAEVLTDDPAVRKAADDILFDLYGEENTLNLDFAIINSSKKIIFCCISQDVCAKEEINI